MHLPDELPIAHDLVMQVRHELPITHDLVIQLHHGLPTTHDIASWNVESLQSLTNI
jgi:hypothetical protein